MHRPLLGPRWQLERKSILRSVCMSRIHELRKRRGMRLVQLGEPCHCLNNCVKSRYVLKRRIKLNQAFAEHARTFFLYENKNEGINMNCLPNCHKRSPVFDIKPIITRCVSHIGTHYIAKVLKQKIVKLLNETQSATFEKDREIFVFSD